MADVLVNNPVLRRHWYPVARTIDVLGAPVPVKVLGVELVLWRSPDGSAVAAPDRCPHRQSPLSPGWVEDGCLVCPYHGWSFGDGGRCTNVPSSSDGLPVPPRAHLPVVRTQERYGLVWVCLDEPLADIPKIAYDDDLSFRRINMPVEEWKCSATRMTDNFCDITHFPWVHTGTFGRRQDTKVPKVDLIDLDDWWHGYRYDVTANNQSVGTVASGQGAGLIHRTMTTGFALPFMVRSTIAYDSGLEHILLLLSTPIDDVTSYFTFVVWRNDDFSVPADEVTRLDLAIGAEDKVMLEKIPGVLPLDQTSLVSVQADKCSVEWRRRLAEAISS